jgi:hypothetical protein
LDELREDLRSLRVDLAGPLGITRLDRELHETPGAGTCGDVRRMGEPLCLSNVLLENAALSESLHGRQHRAHILSLHHDPRLGAVAVRLEQRPHTADREAEQQTGDRRPARSRDSQLGTQR